MDIKAAKESLKIECDMRGISYEIMHAIITVESEWKNQTARHEKNFTYIVKADYFANQFGISLSTEITLQKMSYGLCQIMGGTARDLGYKGWLPELFSSSDPSLNIFWGCTYFEKRCEFYLDVKDKIAAYNAGSVRKKSDGTYVNQGYVDKVSKLLL